MFKKAIRVARWTVGGSIVGGTLGALTEWDGKKKKTAQDHLERISKAHATFCVLADLAETLFHEVKASGNPPNFNRVSEVADQIKCIWIRDEVEFLSELDDSPAPDQSMVN